MRIGRDPVDRLCGDRRFRKPAPSETAPSTRIAEMTPSSLAVGAQIQAVPSLADLVIRRYVSSIFRAQHAERGRKEDPCICLRVAMAAAGLLAVRCARPATTRVSDSSSW